MHAAAFSMLAAAVSCCQTAPELQTQLQKAPLTAPKTAPKLLTAPRSSYTAPTAPTALASISWPATKFSGLAPPRLLARFKQDHDRHLSGPGGLASLHFAVPLLLISGFNSGLAEGALPMAPSALLSLPEELQARIAVHLLNPAAAADQRGALVLGARGLVSLRMACKDSASFGKEAMPRPLLLALTLLSPRITRQFAQAADCFALWQQWHQAQISRLEAGDLSYFRDSLALKRAVGSVQDSNKALLRLMDSIAARVPEAAPSERCGVRKWAA